MIPRAADILFNGCVKFCKHCTPDRADRIVAVTYFGDALLRTVCTDDQVETPNGTR